jgi:hypothetical protein
LRPRARPIVVITLAILFALALAAVAPARIGPGPPRSLVRVNGHVKRIDPWSVEWVGKAGEVCARLQATGVPSFSPRARVDRHATPRIVFHKTQRPKRVRVYAATHLRNGYLADPERPHVTLHQLRRGDHHVWVAKFRTPVRHRLFVDVAAHWRDREGCGGPQMAHWDFSLRRTSSSRQR